MKKTLFLIAAFLLASVISYAQTEKGNQTLGLNLGFSYTKSNGINTNPYDNSSTEAGSKGTGFGIGPNYSYFIADKLDLGASLSYGMNNTTYPFLLNNLSKQSNYNYSGVIYLRKYFMYNDKLGLRAGPYVSYTKVDSKTTYSTLTPNPTDNYEAKIDNYGAGLNLGMVYYPSKRLGVAASLASLDYAHSKSDYGVRGHLNGDNVNLNFINNGLALSVFYVFGSK
jgi:hypothetical protein